MRIFMREYCTVIYRYAFAPSDPSVAVDRPIAAGTQPTKLAARTAVAPHLAVYVWHVLCSASSAMAPFELLLHLRRWGCWQVVQLQLLAARGGAPVEARQAAEALQEALVAVAGLRKLELRCQQLACLANASARWAVALEAVAMSALGRAPVALPRSP